MVLAKELQRLGITMGRVYNVLTDCCTTAGKVACCALANGYAAACGPAQG